MALWVSPTLTGHTYSDVLYSFTIGFVGAILFLLVDKHEPEGALARLMKFSDPVRGWRRNPAQVAALRSRAVLAEICSHELPQARSAKSALGASVRGGAGGTWLAN